MHREKSATVSPPMHRENSATVSPPGGVAGEDGAGETAAVSSPAPAGDAPASLWEEEVCSICLDPLPRFATVQQVHMLRQGCTRNVKQFSGAHAGNVPYVPSADVHDRAAHARCLAWANKERCGPCTLLAIIMSIVVCHSQWRQHGGLCVAELGNPRAAQPQQHALSDSAAHVKSKRESGSKRLQCRDIQMRSS